MKRIFIIGHSGSAKTTLAKELGSKLNIDAYDIDDYYWLPSWQERKTEDFIKLISNVIDKETWVFSGNSSKLKNLLWDNCDTVIWLDYSIMRCMYGALKRMIHNIMKRESVCNGNCESFTKTFSNIFDILFSYNKKKKAYGKYFENKIEGKDYIVFKAHKETDHWLKGFDKAYSSNKHI